MTFKWPIYCDRREPHWVYRQYDVDDRLLYVGMTPRPGARLKRHHIESPWAHLIFRTEWDIHHNRYVAQAHEDYEIKTLAPLYNIAGSLNPVKAKQRRERLRQLRSPAAT